MQKDQLHKYATDFRGYCAKPLTGPPVMTRSSVVFTGMDLCCETKKATRSEWPSSSSEGQSRERLYFTSNEPVKAAVPQWILIPAFPLLSASVMVNSSAESPTFSVFKGSSAM